MQQPGEEIEEGSSERVLLVLDASQLRGTVLAIMPAVHVTSACLRGGNRRERSSSTPVWRA